jgi:hypothetical protein
VQLLPSMTATLSIVTQSADNTVLVPNAALSYAGANGTVDVLQDGAVTPVRVQTGITDGVNTQVLSGLSGGEQLVTGSSGTKTSSSSTTSSSTRSILSGTTPGAPRLSSSG